MRFSLNVPKLRHTFKGTEGDIARSVTSAMRRVTDGLKADLRADVVEAGLGQRLANTWRGKTFPETAISVEAASFVWSKAPDIIDAFDRGVTIRSKRGFWLAIPTPTAGATGLNATGARKRITPGGWERAHRHAAALCLSPRPAVAARRRQCAARQARSCAAKRRTHAPRRGLYAPRRSLDCHRLHPRSTGHHEEAAER